MPDKCKLGISYILPVYNEEEIIGKTILRILESLDRDFADFELILVDDGSKDQTGRILDDAAKKDNRIIVLHNVVNLNLGISFLRGVYSATKEFVTWNAADLPMEPEKTVDYMVQMQDCDLLVLERIEYKGTNLWRKITSGINRFFLTILFPGVKKGLSDTNYVQIYRRAILNRILPLARSPIFVWPEMIFRAKYCGLCVRSMKVVYNPEFVRKGAFGKPNDMIWGFYDMVRFRIRKWRGKA